MRFNKLKKLFSAFLSIMLCFCVVGNPLAASAKTRSELESEKKQIQQKIDAANKKIAELKEQKELKEEYAGELRKKIDLLQDEIDVIQADADVLRGQINTNQDKIDKVQAKIDEAERKIEEIQNKINQLQAEFDATYELYCQRLRAMYISGSVTTLEILLTCEDLSSMLTRSEMIKSVSEQDSETLDSLMTKMEEIEKSKQALQDKRIELNKDKQELVSKKEELVGQKSKLDANIAQIESKKSEYSAQVAECNAVIASIASTTNDCMETIAESQEEIDRIESTIQSIINQSTAGESNSGSNSSASTGKGQFRYPTDYTKISGTYPNYRSGGYHGGVDFPCPVGSNVYAAAAGKVIACMPTATSGGYGNCVMISHGNGLVTLYAHNSSILVSVGQSVSKGTVIAKSGNTGRSTGPHCHFEVRLNGSRVSPYPYLGITGA